MDFDYSPKTKELQAKLNQFMADMFTPLNQPMPTSWPPTQRQASAGRHSKRLKISNPKRKRKVCGICFYRWTAPPLRATAVPV
jgi:hypothetical protein